MSFCLHVSSSSSFLSFARTIVRTLVCTHTRTRTLLTARFRWPRFVTMRFGSSVVPLHLVPFHRQPHTPLSVLSFSFSSVPFCVHMCLPPFRAGWRSHMPPFGEACVCVCVTLGIIGILLDLLGLLSYFLTVVPAGGLVVHASTSPTKRLALNTDIGGDAHRRTCIFRTLRKWNPRPACGTAFSSAPCSHRDPVGLRSSFSAGGSGRSLGTATNEDAHLIW